MTRHGAPRPRYGLSRLWRAPRQPLKESLWFRSWIAVVCLPIALLGEGIREIAIGSAVGAVWLIAFVLLLLVYTIYVRRPVERPRPIETVE